MSRSLLSYDISAIQRYVFATDRLREIRGASAILDELNREQLTNAAKHADPSVKSIFAGGGAGLFEIASSASQAVVDALRRTCNEKTDTATLHTAVLDLNTNHPFPELFRTLHQRLRIAKGSNPKFISAPSHSFLRTCDSCGEHYASEADPDEKTEKMVCRACGLKIRRSKEIKKAKQWPGFWGRLREKLSAEVPLDRFQRPEDLDEMCPNRQDMALIYADGDGLGKLFARCRSSEEVGEKSKRVENGLLDALAEATRGVLGLYKEETLPFDIFLLGGDDLVLAIRAKYAFNAATTLIEKFASASGGSTLSVGIAIAHAHYPLRDLIRLAYGALRQAKHERYLRAQSSGTKAPGMFSYVLVSNLSQSEYESRPAGEGEPGAGVVRRTLRPYTASELKQILKVTASVKRSLPRTKLEALRVTAFLDREPAIFEGLSAMLRVPEKSRDAVYKQLREIEGWQPRDFPWLSRGSELANPWGDISDLADFVSTPDGVEVGDDER